MLAPIATFQIIGMILDGRKGEVEKSRRPWYVITVATMGHKFDLFSDKVADLVDKKGLYVKCIGSLETRGQVVALKLDSIEVVKA